MSHVPLRIGIRAGRLGQILGEQVAERLRPLLGTTPVVFVPIEPASGRDASWSGGWPGADLERAIARGEIDIAVQNAKHLPPATDPDVLLAAVTERVTPFDVLIAREGTIMDEISEGAVISAHTSLRRGQLLRYRDDFKIVDLPGNLGDRIRMLDSSEVDGLVVSASAVEHLGFQDRVTEIFTTEVLVPAAGQGACAIEVRHGAKELLKLVKHLDHPVARSELESERAFVRELKADASMAVGALASINGPRIRLEGLVADREGRKVYRDFEEGKAGDELQIGMLLAKRLLTEGARRILMDSGSPAR